MGSARNEIDRQEGAMNRVSSPKHIVVVDRMMMADIPEFCLVRTDKLEDHPVRLVNPKAPHLMMFGMQLFGMEGGVEGVALEQVRFGGGFSLNGWLKFLKQAIKGRGRRNLDHARLLDQFSQGLPFGDSTSPMISLRRSKGGEKFRSIQADRVTECFKVRPRDLNIEALPCSLRNPGRKRVRHGLCPLGSSSSSTRVRMKSQMTLSNAVG